LPDRLWSRRGAGLVAGQGHQDRREVVLVAAEVLRDLPGLDPADGQVDDDAVGVEALGADAGLEARGGRLDPEVVGLAEVLAQARQQGGIGADDQDLMIDLGLQVAQGHPVLLEEPEQVLARDPAVLRARDAISAQAARVEPLAHGPGRDLADLRDLAGGKHFFHIEDSTRVWLCETSEVS
jgi:hypothetical protein